MEKERKGKLNHRRHVAIRRVCLGVMGIMLGLSVAWLVFYHRPVGSAAQHTVLFVGIFCSIWAGIMLIVWRNKDGKEI